MSGHAVTGPQGPPVDLNKAIELAGKTPMKPVTLGNAALVGILVTPEQAAQFHVVPLSHQSVNINIQQNITINNFNVPPQEPPKRGNHEGSQGRLDQSRQQAPPPSRSLEDRPFDVNTLSSKVNPAPTAYPKSHDGAVGRPGSSGSSQCAQGQTRPTQDVHKSETDSVRTTRPADGLAPPRPPQGANRNSAPPNVTAARAQGQAHQQKTQPENNNSSWTRLKAIGSRFARDQGSRQKANPPALVANSPAPTRHDSNPTGSRESSTVKRPQNHGNSQPPNHHDQAPSKPPSTVTSGRQAVAGPPHVGPQPKGQHGAVGVPQRRSAVGQETTAAAPVAEEIQLDQILAGFERLNSSLGNFKPSRPTRVILIGKSATEIMQLEDREQAYHIDVILDLPAGDKLRECMRHSNIIKLFREFDQPPEPPREPHAVAPPRNSFFGPTEQARAKALGCIIDKESHVLDNIAKWAHLKVYLMSRSRALRFELGRLAHPDVDEKTKRASGNLVVRLLWGDPRNRTQAGRGQTYKGWRNSLEMEDGSPVPDVDALIRKVERLFKERYGEQDIV
ncbi:hypothetical protein KVR01_008504 [Diaporthe batatas]|uniref:uncharacterized protein n=1 Tax=Diaporthe batatas TaxID=748121 RepID=UPI001D058A66|nr:uncharacterized protein KVR01_008504 [Diaporthe batatas]KAG8161517.1 hypothetical protein KVR01_008504 [Diaporthe batatas]